MTVQRRTVHGDDVTKLSHLSAPREYGVGRHCGHCGGPVNRYQEYRLCCRCEDAGLTPPEPEPARLVAVEDVMVDPFHRDMSGASLRDTCQTYFGSMGRAAKVLKIKPGCFYNYSSHHDRPAYRHLPQKHIDRLNAWVRGEVE